MIYHAPAHLGPYLLIQPSCDQSIKSGIRARSDKQNVGRIDLHRFTAQFTRRVPLRYIHDRTLKHLKHSLLDTFTTDVAQLVDTGNGTDLVHFIQKHDSGLCSLDTVGEESS